MDAYAVQQNRLNRRDWAAVPLKLSNGTARIEQFHRLGWIWTLPEYSGIVKIPELPAGFVYTLFCERLTKRSRNEVSLTKSVPMFTPAKVQQRLRFSSEHTSCLFSPGLTNHAIMRHNNAFATMLVLDRARFIVLIISNDVFLRLVIFFGWL